MINKSKLTSEQITGIAVRKSMIYTINNEYAAFIFAETMFFLLKHVLSFLKTMIATMKLKTLRVPRKTQIQLTLHRYTNDLF